MYTIDLVETIEELIKNHPDYQIYVTGHSLGAALSTLFGFELSHKINELKNCHCFICCFELEICLLEMNC